MNTACREHRSALPGISFRSWSRACRIALLVFAALGLCLTASDAFAQATTPAPKIEERAPGLYYFPIEDSVIGENGPLERVIDFPAEEFRKWYKEFYSNSTPKNLPKYSLEDVTANISIEGSHALLDVTYEVVPHASGWIRIPIGLQHAIFRSPVEVYPDLSARLDRPSANMASNGYSLWCEFPDRDQVLLSPEANTPVTFRVQALLPLSVRSDETSLETNLPADTKCVVKLDIPQPGANVSHKGSMVEKDLPELPPIGHSMKLLEFAGGTLSLSWRFDEQAMSEQPVSLKAKGQIIASVDVEETVTTEATLQVESTTIPFDSFIVEIDDDAEFIPPTTSTADYTIRPQPSQGQTFSNRLLVELDEPTKGPKSVTIKTRQTEPVPGDRGKRRFTIGQFDIVGCDVQDGTLSVSAAGNVHVTWDTPRVLREQSSRSSDAMTYRATFSYDQQPATLVLHTLPIQSTARVKSDYELFVGKLNSQLIAKLSYRLPRSYNDDLIIDLNGWTIDAVDTQGAALWQIAEGDADQLILPLASETGAEAMTNAPYRTIEVNVKAQRDHEGDAPSEITLPWPIPRAEPLGTATVTAIPDENIEIRFQSEKSEGFQLDRSRSQEVELSGERGTIVLRASPNQEALQLGLKLTSVIPRLIIGSTATVKLAEGNDEAEVIHEFTYEPFHSSPEKAVFNLPDSVYFFQVTTAEINSEDVAGQKVVLGDSQNMVYSLANATPPYRIKLRYKPLLSEVTPDSGEYQLDLMTPKVDAMSEEGIDVDFKPLQLTFNSPQPVDVLSKTDNWQSFPSSEEGQTVQIPGDQYGQIRFAAPFLVPKSDDRVVVDFHWLQVALTPDERRDRAVFTLRTSADELDVKLPAGAESVELFWNGTEQPFTLKDNQLKLEIPQHSDTGRDRLELWYKYPAGEGVASSMTVNSPEIENSVLGTSQPGREGGYTYLQLITPGNWLVLSASNMSEEMDWAWNHGRYRRAARMTQKQLESLAKTNITTGYPDGMNRSLYSTIGPIENVQITSAKTSYLMLIFSGAALAILLTLFYLPQTRHVLVFGAAAIVTVALAVAYPDFAVLLGEMSTLGIMLAILGIVLYRLASYRTPVKSAVRARSSSDSQASVPSSPPSASGNHSAISTTSMPATVPSSGQSR
ncbi:hypothetical protein ACYFX5_21065 [Bremerella sp. T1]|uniref:hypothetical protein n=1 Tax=Bremerella sp. TYQ1 TaxID=3119568 RepID=UPI001CCFD3C5|nr:hypothetical protein [Bremerella volcania]UBM35534.1 hypothetical protein LA756_23005 [Bremerella volcania]